MRAPRTSWIVASACAATLTIVPVATAGSTPEPAVAVQQLNEWRQRVGVQPVTEDPQMVADCRAHAEYYRLNDGARGHSEDPARPGYTESGDRGASSSVLSYGGGGRGPLTWENAIYHRTSLLNPRLATTGYWSEHGLTCMATIGPRRDPAASLQSFAYPYDGQTDVPTTFGCNESPNPCDAVPGSRSTGFMPSLQFDGPGFRVPTAIRESVTATVTPDGGAPLALLVDPRTGDWPPDGGVALLPVAPLLDGTWYTVQVAGTVRIGALPGGAEAPDEPFARTWRFRTTMPEPDAGDAQRRPVAPSASSRRKQPLGVTVSATHATVRFGATRGRVVRTATVTFTRSRGAAKVVRVRAAGTRRILLPSRTTKVRVTLPRTAEWLSGSAVRSRRG